MGDEPEVADPVRTRERADRDLGRLHGWRVDRPAAIEIERDPARLDQVDDLGRSLERDPAELDPVREHHHVGREAVAAEVRGLPELRRRRAAASARRRAAARAGRSTRRGGRGRRRGRSARRPRHPPRSRCVGRSSSAPISCRVAEPPDSSERARMTADAATPVGTADEQHLAGERCERLLDVAGARPLSATASLPHAPRASTSSQLEATVAVPASGSPPASDEAAQVTCPATVVMPAAGRRGAGRAPGRSRALPRTPGTRRRPSRCRGPGARPRARGCSSACARAR